MASSLSERDFKTAGDGLLTFDSITGREWLDPFLTVNMNPSYIQQQMLSGGAYGGFKPASTMDVVELIHNSGISASPVIGDLFTDGLDIHVGHPSYYSINVTGPDKWFLYDLFFLLDSPTSPTNKTAITWLTSDGDVFALGNNLYATWAQTNPSMSIGSTRNTDLNYFQQIFLYNDSPSQALIDTNAAPTKIENLYENGSITENATYEQQVGRIHVTDADSNDTYTLTLSGSDANLFSFTPYGDDHYLIFQSSTGADYETQSSYNVTVTATDSGGLSKSQQFTIEVTDVDETTSTDNGDNSTYSGKNNDSGDTTTPTTQNTLYGTVGNDILDGFTGYDIIDGKEGLDTVKYSVASTEVSYSENDSGQLVIQNSANASLYTGKNASGVESDTLVSMERIQFSDKNYALDLDGNAGVAAKAVITCFGQDSLDLYMSSALTLADGGSTLDEICELVASMGYIESIKGLSTNSSFVDFIFENVVGRVPNFLESSMYTTYLDDGAYTKGSLLTLAAGTELVGKQLTESAVDLIGVAGSADGEILALQYDLGLG